MALSLYSPETAKAFISDEMPKMRRPGRTVVKFIPEDVLEVLDCLEIGENAPLGVAPLSDDNDKAKEEKAEVVATITAWNRIAKRDKLPFVFHLRTVEEDGAKSVKLYGRFPNPDEVQNGDNDQVVNA